LRLNKLKNMILPWFGAITTTGIVTGCLLNPFFNDWPWFAFVYFVLAGLNWMKHLKTAILLVLCGLVWVGSWFFHPSGPTSLKMLVYGVDGATFAVMDPHAQTLPHFTALKEEGTRAVLTSMEPMFSPLLWTTIASGRKPDEHGIRGFHVQSKDCKVARFWDIAENAGMGLGLYKWLVDYPPRKVNGFWVPSWLAPAPETWPPELSVVKELELSKRLRRKQVAQTHSTPALVLGLVKAGVRLGTLMDAALWSVEERILKPKPARANTKMQLLRGRIDRDVFVRQVYLHQPRLATFTYYATDGLAHLYWDSYEAGGQELLSAYQQADAILGNLQKLLGPEARLVVVSDHGFKRMDGSGLAGQFAPTTQRLQTRLGEVVGKVDVTKVGHKLTVGFADKEAREKGEVWLLDLKDSAGNPAYTVASLPDTELALALTLADEQITGERLAKDTIGGEPLSNYVKLTDSYTGTHREDGILYLWGEGVPQGQQLEPVGLLNAAPTILAAAGLPAAVNMPGKAVVFQEKERVESWDALVPVLSWLDGQEGVNEAQLEALGYSEK
jgi:hypothetical protein